MKNYFEATLYMANVAKNDMMRRFDLSEDGKYYVDEVRVEIETSSVVDEKYIHGLIDKSWKEGEDDIIVGIIFNAKMYIHSSVKVISDGQHYLWVRR